MAGNRVGDQGKQHAKEGCQQHRQIPLLTAAQHQEDEGGQQHHQTGAQQADGPHHGGEAVAVAPLEEDVESVVFEGRQQVVLLEVAVEGAANQRQTEQAGDKQQDGVTPLLVQAPVAEQHQIPCTPEGAVVGAHPGDDGKGEGRHQRRPPAKAFVQQQGDEGPLGDEGEVEGPVLGHVAVVVAGAIEGQQCQHGAKARPDREAKLGESLPAGHQPEPAEYPLQRPDPDKSPQTIPQRIEGEDHRPLDIDHVAIEHPPFTPHFAHDGKERGVKPRRHGMNERVAQAEEQRQQRG